MAVEACPDSYPPGSLVNVCGRDLVVLPSLEKDVLRLRPLTGGEDQLAGIYLPIEGLSVWPAVFEPPDVALVCDTIGRLLLCDPVPLSLRSGASLFRSLGRLSVVPRPSQFVPLNMALRRDPVCLPVADEVGVGKTVGAARIARQPLDRAIACRLAVLCPAHLCDQWEQGLREKFGIQASVVQHSRIAHLERELPTQDPRIYQYYPHLIASIDFVKAGRSRNPFLRNATGLVIVDEAGIVERPRGDAHRAEHQRCEPARDLVADPDRHLLLTASPYSGIEESFRSLLALIHASFDIDPHDPTADRDHRQLVPHLVQRRRGDVKAWLGPETPFPARKAEEITYSPWPAYQALFEGGLGYCRETVSTGWMGQSLRQRVRSRVAIAMLRCVLSSPEAVVAFLAERPRRGGQRTDGGTGETGDISRRGRMNAIEEIDSSHRPQVLDPIDDESLGEYVPAVPLRGAEPLLSDAERRKLSRFLRQARALTGPQRDRKLAVAAETLRKMLRQGFHPIVFCRFIATAGYLQTRLLPFSARSSRSFGWWP